MCGRYSFALPPDALHALFRVVTTLNLQPRYNIAPTQDAPVIGRDKDGRRALKMFRWGLEGGRPERGKRSVWILGASGLPEEVQVKVGISDGRNTEITGGDLPEGALVITGIEGAEPTTQPPPGGPPGGRRGGFGRIL